MEKIEAKKIFLYILVFSVIVCATVAVVYVLTNEFSDTLGNILLTLLLFVVHSLFALMIISGRQNNSFENFEFFFDILFLLVIASFFTAILDIWGVIEGSLMGDLYKFYFVLAFAALHGNVLFKASDKETYIDITIILNYFFMVVVVVLLGAVIFMQNPTVNLPEPFFRILGASAIIDATLSILILIFYKWYFLKNPREENTLQTNFPYEQKQKSSALSIVVWILIIYLVLQVFFGFFIRSIFRFF